jgi:hypothetical protein
MAYSRTAEKQIPVSSGRRMGSDLSWLSLAPFLVGQELLTWINLWLLLAVLLGAVSAALFGLFDLNVFFSVPLCYCYPAMLHYKAVSRTRKQKLADIVLIIFGFITAAYTTIQTLGVRLRLFLDRLILSLTYYTFLV